ncbi:MAG: hypothetical protein ACK40K_06230, partial [Raineya sp.]
MQKLFLILAFLILLSSCSKKEQKQTQMQAIDTTAGLPETLPQAQIDEKFLNYIKEIRPARFVMYEDDA